MYPYEKILRKVKARGGSQGFAPQESNKVPLVKSPGSTCLSSVCIRAQHNAIIVAMAISLKPVFNIAAGVLFILLRWDWIYGLLHLAEGLHDGVSAVVDAIDYAGSRAVT